MSVKKHTVWNLFGNAAPMVIGLATMPYMYKHLGTERLGVLTIIWALIGYFSIFDFGLGRALTQRIARISPLTNNPLIGRVSKSGVLLTFIIGLAGGLLGILLIKAIGIGWLKASKEIENEVRQSFLAASLTVPIVTTTTGLRGILEGLKLFHITNTLKFTLGIFNFIGPVISIVLFGPNLAYIIVTLSISRFLILIGHLWATNNSTHLLNSSWCKNTSMELLHFGSWMTISNIIGPLMVVADRFIISAVLGASSVAFYTVPSEFLTRLLILPAALTTSLFPVLTYAISQNDKEAKSTYARSIRIIFTMMLPITVTIMMGSHFGLKLWLNATFADHSYVITSILALGILFNSLAQIPLTTIQASGDARTTAILYLVEASIYLPLLLFAIHVYGLKGAAMAWTMRTLVDLSMLHIRAKQILHPL